jgi:hypothetical protein
LKARVGAQYDEPNFTKLHDLARHIIHVSEGLQVAAGTILELAHICKEGKESRGSILEDMPTEDHEEAELEIWARAVGNLQKRSDSLKERLSNEIQLVWTMFSFGVPPPTEHR